jgi:hypothetical protein
MKYVVAEGVSFYNGGKVYAPGDVITKSIFKPETAFDDAVSKGQILAVEEKDEKKADAEKADEAKKADAAADEAEKKGEADKKAGSKKGGK